ncbi:hypothetical protein HPB47_023209 [Ixodes persulcatus]|uniref:Uncharacterized protein n=1 Tax=Ixodes persulcatus TaxID=34615 RepID=A0AC60QB00_IXOPE|nr:hypothetical protein HPB47_023209 [Ixodes persulcatus]
MSSCNPEKVATNAAIVQGAAILRTTKLISEQADDSGATPSDGETVFSINGGDSADTSQAAVSSEVYGLVLRLSSRLDILTAEIKLLRADNSALQVEVAQLRQAVVNQSAAQQAIAVSPEDAAPAGSPPAKPSYASVALAPRPLAPPRGQARDNPGNVGAQRTPFSLAPPGNGESSIVPG